MQKYPEKLSDILNDKTSGSKELLAKLNEYLIELSAKGKIATELLQSLKKDFSEFSAIVNYLEQLLPLVDSPLQTKNFLLNYKRKELDLPKILCDKLKPFLKGRTKIITVSNSKTITDVFLLMKKQGYDFSVTVTESRPRNEGVIMANKLAGEGIETFLITEAMIGTEVKNIHLGIIGADKILNDGSVINKTGSLTLAIVLKYYQKPLIVLADKTKKSNENSYTPQIYPPEEILKNKNPMMHVTNYYFERVNATLITKILTD